MIIYYLKKDGLVAPKKANPSDAGFDIIATSGPKIVGELWDIDYYRSIDYIEYGTNLFVKPAKGFEIHEFKLGDNFQLDLRPRSSISKYNLILANSPATIDESYRGEIKVRFKYIFQPEDLKISNGIEVNKKKIYNIGDRICQLLGRIVTPIRWIEVDQLDETVRGAGGFGSTGQ